ncbi:MAG: PDZ domain-containing protein [Verrucomicrobiia bacterium]|jgi:S1-C subfamily serine protease
MKKIIISFILWFLALTAVLIAAEPEKSVIQIINFSQQPVWDAPWRFDALRRSGGSGFVIKGKRIMSNAHVVSWAKQILVKRYQDPKLYTARVAYVGHDCDLALLEVDDQSFFEGLEPLEIGELPKVRSTVITYGYPAGGEQISYTRGVVSRIDLQTYVHIGNRSFLCVQTDAAINPGNSGGPVIQEGLVVGVAFQGMQGLENTGFFIPPPVIRHFLKDVEDGVYNGFPTAGIRIAPLQNPAFREFLGVKNDGIGARIDSIMPIESTRKLLQEDDVLLQVGDFVVGSDATILYEGNRVHVAVAFQAYQHGESVKLKILRHRKEMTIDLPLYVNDDDKPAGNQYDVLPKYFIYGGLVFTPLSLDYLKTFGRDWSEPANAELVYELLYRKNEDSELARKEPVVLATILPHPINANFSIKGRALVDSINGIKIQSLADVVKAFEKPTGDFHIIKFMPHDSVECLKVAETEKVNHEILKIHDVPSDRRL